MNQEREAVALEPGDLEWLDCTRKEMWGNDHDAAFEHNARIDRIILALRSGGEGWQDISTAPKDGTRVLVHDGREPVVAFWHEDVRWERDCHASTADRDVTERVVGGWWEAYAETVVHPAHWKPLNAPSPSTHGEG